MESGRVELGTSIQLENYLNNTLPFREITKDTFPIMFVKKIKLKDGGCEG